MEPRFFTVEGNLLPGTGGAGCLRASMEPRFFTVEGVDPVVVTPINKHASMEPRFFTVEGMERHAEYHPTFSGFNGATVFHRGRARRGIRGAARHPCFNGATVFHRGRGKALEELRQLTWDASMEPRFFTVEGSCAMPVAPRR